MATLLKYIPQFEEEKKKKILENVLLEAKLRFGYINCWASGSAVWVVLGGFRYKVTCMADLEYIPTLCEHKSPDLEDLAGEPRRKRRRLDKLIDKSTQLDSDYYRVRIANELRCATAKEDVIQPRTPAVTLLSRPARSVAKPLCRYFSSKLGDIFRSSARAADKENIPVEINIQGTENMEVMPPQSTQKHNLNIMLQQAGLADVVQEPVTPRPPDVEPQTSEAQRARDGRGSETPLGSLDRSKVSLGDTDKTTDSQRFIDEEWGTRGTMFKILRCALMGVPDITVELLLRRGPVLEGSRRRIAARCFTSILKLSSQRFIKIIKDADTNEIKHIELGPRIPLPGRN